MENTNKKIGDINKQKKLQILENKLRKMVREELSSSQFIVYRRMNVSGGVNNVVARYTTKEAASQAKKILTSLSRFELDPDVVYSVQKK